MPLPVSLARRPSNGRAGLGPALLVCVAILGPPPDRVLAGAPSADRPGFFTDVSRQLGLDFVHDPAGIGDEGYGMGVAVGDMDNDGDPDVYVDVLAAAYAASGRFEEAQAACRRAVSLAAGTPAAGEIAGRLDLYGRKRRYVSRASSP